MKKMLLISALATSMALPLTTANAADYVIDTQGAHASINFKVSHLGYSFTMGRFNKFDGEFSYDPANLDASKVSVTVDTSSIDSNHATRDKHIRSADLMDVKKFPKATFTSTKVVDKGEGKLDILGELTLHGQTKPLTINAEFIGGGADPWGSERAGFQGTARIELNDFGIPVMAGATYADMQLFVEGIKK